MPNQYFWGVTYLFTYFFGLSWSHNDYGNFHPHIHIQAGRIVEDRVNHVNSFKQHQTHMQTKTSQKSQISSL